MNYHSYVGFNNADPRHAKMNRLRARKDMPHIWYEGGWWRVSPKPIKRRQFVPINNEDWALAHLFVRDLNMELLRSRPWRRELT